LLDGYIAGTFDKVVVAYTRFINTLSQETTVRELLPAPTVEVESTHLKSAEPDYVFEPDPASLINWVIPYRFELMLYQTVLDARASEHSARMVAMKNAHDNAKDLVGGLTIDYNRERQSTVTNELLDVTTARIALGE
jgi:F-type H+-transporting ATPase subunit gamma